MNANDILTKARRTLNDDFAASYRWSDSDLIDYIDDMLRDLYKKRPEFWLTNTGVFGSLILVDSGDLTVILLDDDEILPQIAAFVSSAALSEDDSDKENLNRAQILMNKYNELIG
jgi:hypothetical protein